MQASALSCAPSAVSAAGNTSFYLPEQSLSLPSSMGQISVGYTAWGLFVMHNGEKRQVAPYDLSVALRNRTPGQLGHSFEHGYVRVARIGQDYALTYNPGLLGAGPVAGAIAYWATKTLCYSAITGAVATGLAGAVGGADWPWKWRSDRGRSFPS